MTNNNVRVKSNLKSILDERGVSIRKLANETGLKFETVRRLYNDQTKQYQRDSIGAICVYLSIEVGDLLTLTDEGEYEEEKRQ
ncbi:helix-turn-helix domain-containing protein [Gracilibacillus thailandensis]|uniref:Helix-turn-helix domain-containing protein n=1 Tax=Gracilibacillus thailandensis TaxID=563735 RepID=A0A6N7QTF6_9BACI|nr:helix-turn-helix transcriptional regulator [Gracilibacillus thailandensis]MRI65343.1 helix-turn-helix domain-containing protein [Gracilibacillus thailandensis]